MISLILDSLHQESRVNAGEGRAGVTWCGAVYMSRCMQESRVKSQKYTAIPLTL